MKLSTLILALGRKKKFLLDTLDRVAFTFAAAFFAVYAPILMHMLGTGNFHALADLSLAQKALVAGSAAVATFVKSLFGSKFGDPETGALLSKNSGPQLIEVPVEIEAGAADTVGDQTTDVSDWDLSEDEQPAEEQPAE